MWQTPIGQRVLHGAEAELFKHGVESLVQEIEQSAEIEEEHSVGVLVFDELKRPQKLQMIESVAMALLDAKVPAPPANALTDATVGAIYEQLRIELEIEFDKGADSADDPKGDRKKGKKRIGSKWPPDGFEEDDFRYWWRRVVLDCARRMELDDVPEATELGQDAWYRVIWQARAQVLRRSAWDNDRKAARARAMKTLGIGRVPAYFEVSLPDAASVPVDTVSYVIRRLVRSLGSEKEQAARRRPAKPQSGGTKTDR